MLPARSWSFGPGIFSGAEGRDDDGIIIGAGITLGLFFVGEDGGGDSDGRSGFGIGSGKVGLRGGSEEGLGIGGRSGRLWFDNRRGAGRESGFDGGFWRCGGGGTSGWGRGLSGRRRLFGGEGLKRGARGSGGWFIFGFSHRRCSGRWRILLGWRGRGWGGGFAQVADVIVVVAVSLLIVGVLTFGHFTEEFCEFVFVLAHV